MTRCEIWFINLDPTIGAEIRKTRPCIVISPPQLDYLQARLIAPITSKGFSAPYRVELKLLGKQAKILCDQIRCVSADRFVSKIGELDTDKIEELKEILKEMFWANTNSWNYNNIDIVHKRNGSQNISKFSKQR